MGIYRFKRTVASGYRAYVIKMIVCDIRWENTRQIF